jgi:hypothetical protein
MVAATARATTIKLVPRSTTAWSEQLSRVANECPLGWKPNGRCNTAILLGRIEALEAQYSGL